MNAYLEIIDFVALSPLLILLAGALGILLLESFSSTISKRISAMICCLTLLISLGTSFLAPLSQNPLLTPWLRFDNFAEIFTRFFLSIGIASTLIAYPFFKRFEVSHGEFYFLLLTSVMGLIFIGMAADFLTLFLGLETLSISLYILCGYMKKWTLSHEAAMKYFLIGAFAAALLLYGIALIYGALGTTQLSVLNDYKNLKEVHEQALFFCGIAFITVGIAFKAAIVPFHTWAPDVYDGSLTPVTAFMAVGTKVGAFAAFALIFIVYLPTFIPLWKELMTLLAGMTMIYANLVALRQNQLRRLFAYSGISHAGFLLIPIIAGTSEAFPALLFYLIVYAIATFGSFAVIVLLDRNSTGVMIDDCRGLFYRSPFLGSLFALSLLTLAGIPPLPGFFAKFYIFKVAFELGDYGLVVVGLVMTVVSIFYYIRIIATTLSNEKKEASLQ